MRHIIEEGQKVVKKNEEAELITACKSEKKFTEEEVLEILQKLKEGEKNE